MNTRRDKYANSHLTISCKIFLYKCNGHVPYLTHGTALEGGFRKLDVEGGGGGDSVKQNA